MEDRKNKWKIAKKSLDNAVATASLIPGILTAGYVCYQGMKLASYIQNSTSDEVLLEGAVGSALPALGLGFLATGITMISLERLLHPIYKNFTYKKEGTSSGIRLREEKEGCYFCGNAHNLSPNRSHCDNR